MKTKTKKKIIGLLKRIAERINVMNIVIPEKEIALEIIEVHVR